MPDTVIKQDVIGDNNIFSSSGDVEVNIVYNLPPAEFQDRQKLLLLIDKVERFWIKNVLEKSVNDQYYIELNKEFSLNAIEHPWGKVLELPSNPIDCHKINNKISDIFINVGQLLLIHGEPGSGKTITLLELARDLINHAKKDITKPIPVVFNLSTWVEERHQSIFDWILKELSSKYQIPSKFSKKWILDNRILPLFDGLDEIKKGDRISCIKEIHKYIQGIGIPGMAVCCRSNEYFELPLRLKINGAVRILPLSDKQIETFFGKNGDNISGLREMIIKNISLRELSRNPLILNIMSLTYIGYTFDKLTEIELSFRSNPIDYIFSSYIEKMFQRKPKSNYEKNKIVKHMTWLSKKMDENSISVFLLEDIQPYWLSNNWQLLVYTMLSRFVLGLLTGSCIAIIIGCIIWLVQGAKMDVVIVMISFALMATLATIFLNFCVHIKGIWLAPFLGIATIKAFEQNAIQSDFIGFIIAIPIVLYVIGILVIGIRDINNYLSTENDIITIESIGWSWSGAREGIFLGLKFSLGLVPVGLLLGKGGALSYFLILLLCGFVFGGLKFINIESKIIPNQGIKMTLRNSILIGLISSAIILSCITIGCILVFKIYFSLNQLIVLLGFMLILSIMIGIWVGGGKNVVKHYILRTLLYTLGHTPFSYVKFLDYATSLNFLQKIGGGYIFIHRLLLNHFILYENHLEKNIFTKEIDDSR